MSFITSIGTANPPNRFTQTQISDFMIRAMGLDKEGADKLRVLYRATGIDSRYSVLQDYGSSENFNFYPNTPCLEPFPDTARRLELFRKEALKLSRKAVDDCVGGVTGFDIKSITHLIVVSCTGMSAPGLDVELVRNLNLNSTVQRTSVNFVGCYAAFNAMRLANSFCAQNKEAKILVVCTELCSLHFQKENTEDNLLANALFADGSAALLVEPKMKSGINLEIGAFFCDLAITGEEEMAWSIGSFGFEMKLSSYVPEIVKTGIKKLTSSLLKANHIVMDDISYYAIHPGGKKILEVIEQELNLSKDDNAPAYEVLRNYGNMSSPTVLFVLKEILNKIIGADDNKKILSFGFGPGLTLESLILTIKSSK